MSHVILLIAMSTQVAFPQDRTAEVTVGTFEARLRDWPKDKAKERDDAVREFFAGLKDRDAKIAAIGMTDSRYVYVIPRELVSELMGKLLKDPDLDVRLRAARSLGYNGKGGEHYDALVGLLKEVHDQRLGSVIYAMGRSSDVRFLTHLRTLLKHQDGMVRGEAVFALRGFPREQFKGDLAALWQDPHPQVRYNVLSLMDARNQEDLKRVLDSLKDPSDRVRVHAVDILGRTDRAEVPAIMVKMLADPHPYVRGKALEALGNLHARAHLDVIVSRLQDSQEDVYVRRMAILALEKLGDRANLPLVREMLRDEDNQIREHAARIVEVFAKRYGTGD